MSVHIFEAASSHQAPVKIHALMGYEDGSVCLYCLEGDQSRKTIEGLGWVQLWRVHEHKESGPSNPTFYLHFISFYFIFLSKPIPFSYGVGPIA